MGIATVLLCLLCLLCPWFTHSALAKTHIVGGVNGWTTAGITASFYDDWAKKQIFNVDDTLVFSYEEGTHNVYVVTPDEAKNCVVGNAMQTYEYANATVELYRSGVFAFICQVIGHCERGMKMTLTVIEEPTIAPAPVMEGGSPSDSSPPAPPSQPEIPEPTEAPWTSDTPAIVDEAPPPSAAAGPQSLSTLILGCLFVSLVCSFRLNLIET